MEKATKASNVFYIVFMFPSTYIVFLKAITAISI